MVCLNRPYHFRFLKAVFHTVLNTISHIPLMSLSPASYYERAWVLICFTSLCNNLETWELKKSPYIFWGIVDRDLFRSLSDIEDGAFCENSQRLLAVNYFRKIFCLRCLRGFWILLWQRPLYYFFRPLESGMKEALL